MKTAVEFLINEIPNTIRYALEEEGVIEQAKEMENEQIINEHLEKLIDRNYAAQIKRGQITMKQPLNAFIHKIDEEVKEIIKLSCEEGMLIQRTINDKVKIPYTRIKDFTIKMFEQFKKK